MGCHQNQLQGTPSVCNSTVRNHAAPDCRWPKDAWMRSGSAVCETRRFLCPANVRVRTKWSTLAKIHGTSRVLHTTPPKGSFLLASWSTVSPQNVGPPGENLYYYNSLGWMNSAFTSYFGLQLFCTRSFTLFHPVHKSRPKKQKLHLHGIETTDVRQLVLCQIEGLLSPGLAA